MRTDKYPNENENKKLMSDRHILNLMRQFPSSDFL